MVNDQPIVDPEKEIPRHGNNLRLDMDSCCTKIEIGSDGIAATNYPLISGVYKQVSSGVSDFDLEYTHSDQYGPASRLLYDANEKQWKVVAWK